MGNTLPADLSISRKRSGLSNEDLAHLLGTSKSRVSRLQNGTARLSVKEVCYLCLIHGKPPHRVFRLTNRSLIAPLRQRLSQMPEEPVNWERRRNVRQDTINQLHETLQTLSQIKDAS